MDQINPAAEINSGDLPQRVRWSRVGLYLGLTFGLSWLLDLGIYLAGGLAVPGVLLFLQLQMLIPAFSAMLLNVFVFSDSPIYRRSNHALSRWFVGYFFLLFVLYLAGALLVFLRPALANTVPSVLLLPNFLGLILLLVLRWRGGKDTFSSAGMAGGRPLVWLLGALGLLGYYLLSAALNLVFHLGAPVDLIKNVPSLAASGMPPALLLTSLAINTILIGPFLGLIIAFGEEYGWRGFLQPELIQLGKVKGVLLLGLIWGAWHWPLIWMGYNFPGQPVLGSLLMVLYCIFLAFVLAHAVFKSKGIWTAAYLHAFNNQTISFIIMALVSPFSAHWSFGIGLFSLIPAALVVLLLLRDPVWRE